MSEVTLIVGGRNYKLACEDGQEDHVRKLAGMIDDRMKALGDNLSKIETKDLLFAALFLADELVEAKTGGTAPASPTPESRAPDDEALADVLEAIADQLEKTANSLESRDNPS